MFVRRQRATTFNDQHTINNKQICDFLLVVDWVEFRKWKKKNYSNKQFFLCFKHRCHFDWIFDDNYVHNWMNSSFFFELVYTFVVRRISLNDTYIFDSSLQLNSHYVYVRMIRPIHTQRQTWRKRSNTMDTFDASQQMRLMVYYLNWTEIYIESKKKNENRWKNWISFETEKKKNMFTGFHWIYADWGLLHSFSIQKIFY